MRRPRLFLIGSVFAGGIIASPIAAQQMSPPTMPMLCHNASEIAKQLNSRYDESPVAFGLQANGNLLQVFASAEKNTWTVVSTTPNGLSCIVAAGKTWESLPPTKSEPLT
jgi:hypothetical protein